MRQLELVVVIVSMGVGVGERERERDRAESEDLVFKKNLINLISFLNDLFLIFFIKLKLINKFFNL